MCENEYTHIHAQAQQRTERIGRSQLGHACNPEFQQSVCQQRLPAIHKHGRDTIVRLTIFDKGLGSLGQELCGTRCVGEDHSNSCYSCHCDHGKHRGNLHR